NLLAARELNLGSVELILHTLVVAVTAPLAVLLWTRRKLSLKTLRAIELAIFGVPLLYFSWGQYGLFHDGGAFQRAAEDQQAIVLRLTTFASSLRWFTLIVIYGTFIPNTCKRTTIIVGFMSLLPLVITAGIGLAEGTFVMEEGVLMDMAILMLIAVAVAVFGAHKIEALRMEAFNARQLGQYRLKQRLGSGGMGEVYLAEHQMLKRPCAVKLIRPEKAGDPRMLARFEREVRATAKLSHWNSIDIYDYGRTADGTFYYVMAYLPGHNIVEMVENYGPIPPGRAVYLLDQVCAALAEAHGIGLVHRDIKPANIFC